MLKQSKKWSSIFLVVLLGIMSLMMSLAVYAQEQLPLSEEVILNMESSELLDALLDRGLVLPKDYDSSRDLAEHFVYKYTSMIINGKINPCIQVFNAKQSNQMLNNLAITLDSMSVFKLEREPYFSRYTLKHSTPIGPWDMKYKEYNCYAYSLGKTSGLQPGEISNTYFSILMPISKMADVVLKDLDSLGYNGYKTTTKPTSFPDKWFKVICMRKDTGNEDFHFMKTNGSLNSWAHKPGCTLPLSWNYSSPGYTIWSNEHAYDVNTTYQPTVTYESDIYYIIYKGKNDPGVQPR